MRKLGENKIKNEVKMSKFHKKEDIQNIEENWQKLCYFKNGDGIHYIHCCEMCCRTNEEPEKIPGGHYLCSSCKKKLKLPTERTIINRGQNFIAANEKFKFLSKEHPSEPSKREREKTWEKLIKEDYLIEMYNKNFSYESK